MRNDARPVGEEFRDIAEHRDHDDQTKDRDPAEGARDAVNLDRDGHPEQRVDTTGSER
jgi:hypothetical protein